MLGEARDYLRDAPWTMLFPWLSITLTVLALNLLGDGTRDVLDPRLRKVIRGEISSQGLIPFPPTCFLARKGGGHFRGIVLERTFLLRAEEITGHLTA
jgi:hypothetical protein